MLKFLVHIFINKRIKMKISILSLVFVLALVTLNAQTSENSLANLKEGNERFLNNGQTPKQYLDDVKATSNGQSPYAIILSCADSRVPPELIFDESIGRLFVVRVAGNVTSPEALGSIEYGVDVLKANLIVVLGHTKCGAVVAASSKKSYTPNIDALIARIAPAVDAVEKKDGKGDKVEDMIKKNVENQMANLTSQSSLLADRVKEGKVKIVGGVYSLESGKIELLGN